MIIPEPGTRRDEIEREPGNPPPPPRSRGQRFVQWLRRRWLLLLVLAGFAVLVALQFSNIVALGRTLFQGEIQWILAAVLLQAIYYSVYALLYQLSFETVEVTGSTFELLPVLFASIFLKAVVPSGGVSAVAVFVDDAARRGESGARAAEGALLVLVADLITTVPFIIVALIYLQTRGVLQLYQAFTALLFVLFAAAMGGVLLLGRLQPSRLRDVLQRFQNTVNRIAVRLHRPPLLSANWAEVNAEECIGAACNIAAHPRPLWRALVVAFIVHWINLASLYAVTRAYRQPLGPGPIVAAFSMDIIFSVINIIPHGIGVAEGVISLVFISLGVPAVIAVTIAVAFRGLNVWLPLAIGFFLINRVRAFGARPNV